MAIYLIKQLQDPMMWPSLIGNDWNLRSQTQTLTLSGRWGCGLVKGKAWWFGKIHGTKWALAWRWLGPPHPHPRPPKKDGLSCRKPNRVIGLVGSVIWLKIRIPDSKKTIVIIIFWVCKNLYKIMLAFCLLFNVGLFIPYTVYKFTIVLDLLYS